MNRTPTDTRIKETHRGHIVKRIVDKSGLHVVQVSKMMGRSRAQLYIDFANPDMDWTVIAKIGKVIRHDFAQEFPEFNMYASIVQEPSLKYGESADLDRALIELDKWKTIAYENLAKAELWKDKYLDLIERTTKHSKAS